MNEIRRNLKGWFFGTGLFFWKPFKDLGACEKCACFFLTARGAKDARGKDGKVCVFFYRGGREGRGNGWSGKMLFYRGVSGDGWESVF